MGCFKGGIRLDLNKKRSLLNSIKKASIPALVAIPLAQHQGLPTKAVVSVGDTVRTGTRIGEAVGPLSAHVHASISGTVRKIAHYYHPTLGFSETIQIESDGTDTREDSIQDRPLSEPFSSEEIIAAVRECGVVGMSGDMTPTHIKLSPLSTGTIDTVIINAAESEPYITCDHQLMLAKPLELLKAVRLIVKVLGAQHAYIAIEDNKMDALELLMSKIRANVWESTIKTFPLATKYPHGSEKHQIKTVLNREIARDMQPSDVGVAIFNVATVFAIYEAVYLRKPLYERIVTVTGTCVKSPQNVIARIGTSFATMLNEAGGLLRPASKIIMGGPMTGIAQATNQVPVIKGTTGITTLYETEVALSPSYRTCIRCGACVARCPMGLNPSKLSTLVEQRLFAVAVSAGATACIECGICSYVCPSQRPLTHFMKTAKKTFAESGRHYE